MANRIRMDRHAMLSILVERLGLHSVALVLNCYTRDLELILKRPWLVDVEEIGLKRLQAIDRMWRINQRRN